MNEQEDKTKQLSFAEELLPNATAEEIKSEYLKDDGGEETFQKQYSQEHPEPCNPPYPE